MQRAHQGRRRREGGFTLVELGVVLAVLAVLVAIAVPTYLNMVNRAREAEAQQVWGMVKTELWSYYVQYSRYPEIVNGWWDGIDQPSSGDWTYTASLGSNNQTATLTASWNGRTLCWTIDSNGKVTSAQGDACKASTP